LDNDEALEATIDDKHYMSQVTDMGETREVVASEHIETQDGMRLVSAGTRIDNSMLDRLVQHRLLKPIDTSLNTERAVTVSEVVGTAKRMIGAEPCLEKLLDGIAIAGLALRVLAGITLVPALSFKLTVCREKAPEKLDHMIRVALSSLVLGSRLRMSNNQLIDLATAGLFHDLGEMHVDPVFFDDPRSLTRDEWRQIYAHSIVAFLILKEFPIYHPVVSTAVLHHHELWDGSGYPKGLSGEAISEMGRILGITELLVVMLQRSGEQPDPDRMIEMLKLNGNRYGRQMLEPFIEIIGESRCGVGRAKEADTQVYSDVSLLKSRLATLVNLLVEVPEGPETAENGALAFIRQQLAQVAQIAGRAGINQVIDVDIIDLMAEDALGLNQMEFLAKELDYQLRTIANQVRRRWPNLEKDESAAIWLEKMEKLVIPDSTAMPPGDAPHDSSS